MIRVQVRPESAGGELANGLPPCAHGGAQGAQRLRIVSQAKRAFSFIPRERYLARTIRPFKLTIFCVKTKGIPDSAYLVFLTSLSKDDDEGILESPLGLAAREGAGKGFPKKTRTAYTHGRRQCVGRGAQRR